MQTSKYENLQQMFTDMHEDLMQLTNTCNTLKEEKSQLGLECEEHKVQRATLQQDIVALREERDALRMEMSHAKDRELWWTQQDISNSSGSLAAQGTLHRKIWLLEQEKEGLKVKLDGAATEQAKAVEDERVIARSLRSKIGQLEEESRSFKRQKEETQSQLVALRTEVQGKMEHQESILRQKTSDLQDVLSQLSVVKQKVADLTEQRDSLAEKLAEANARTNEEITTPRKALRARQPNTASVTVAPLGPQSPNTPTKTSHPAAGGVFSPTTSLAKKYAHLEDQHESLRRDYEKLHARYSQDLKHWKEYKALQLAREEMKKKRKAEKKAAPSQGHRGVTDRIVTPRVGPVTAASHRPSHLEVPYKGGPQAPSSQGSTSSQSGVKLVSASDDSQSLPRPAPPANGSVVNVNDVAHREHLTSATLEETDDEQPSEVDYESENDGEATMVLCAQPVRTGHGAPNASHIRESRKVQPSPTMQRLEEMVRHGQWLGGKTHENSPSTKTPVPGSAIRRSKQVAPLHEDDEQQIFEEGYGDSPTIVRTPLVRDRGIGPSTLRCTVDVPSNPAGSDIPDSTKRKRGDLQDLTPSQKSRELKRLNSMSAIEKRSYYAEYKGKGRYVAPERLGTDISMEYEIDPKRNEGVKHQFHDVKRRKVERQKMHGGDCECCQGYYEAVGPLPRYNQGPKWKDGDEGQSSREAIKEHQDQISRHRETWKRAPTPPGYWEIGFPSTQKAEEQNAIADEMIRQRDQQIRQEAAQKDGKWKKRT